MVCEHLVQFYETEDELVDAVVPYLAAGLELGETVLVIATEPHRLAFERRLAATETDIEHAAAAGTYMYVDASKLLAYLRPDHETEPTREDFDATVGRLIRRHTATDRRLRVYGEIVALLWGDGDTAGAIAVEEMWNELQGHERFRLLCGCPGPLSPERLDPSELDTVGHICRSHSHVLPTITQTGEELEEAPISAEFSADLGSPRRVRDMFRTVLRDRDVDDDLIERGTLAASELAANAVVHARTSFRLLVRPMAASVWIGVEDRAPLARRNQVVGRLPHGLGIIAALAFRWGVRPQASGKVVWVEIPL